MIAHETKYSLGLIWNKMKKVASNSDITNESDNSR